ncbi:hypothetical protein B0H15DRAFT_824375 [Mycena belliarum]|uniref:NAD-dependent epimerase/dehydratase domain-containing protein n=1 Tax=Mycena belliarum TaxID=1033014 RepID=A0AAD6XV89_9AGAR|nr:hypothetical protein B0H15DRAFT_824375 [Mycena belliae]
MSAQFNRLPKDSRILVTGGTGLIGSSVTTLLLEKGFKVRVATRSVSKQQAFRETLQAKYGQDFVEFIEIDDFASAQSWDRMLDDVQGVQHLAQDVSFTTEYEAIISATKAMTTTFLTSAHRHKSVKSVVLTSSRIAVYQPEHGKDIHATKNDWNDHFIELAKNAKSDNPAKPMMTYAASKVVEERVAWDFVKESKPHFAFTVVLPDYVAGPVANPSPGSYSTHGWLNDVFKGDSSGTAIGVMDPAARLVDVRDVAAIQVAAMLDETADHRRLFAAPHKFTIDRILAVWRKAFPDRKILDDFNFKDQPIVDVEDEESTHLLEAYMGRGWLSFEETVVANAQDVL